MRHPYRDMQPGDSVVVSGIKSANYARVYAQKTGKKFSRRKVGENTWEITRTDNNHNRADGRRTTTSTMIKRNPNAIVSRAQAKAMGLTVYRTGRPCRYGHTAWRYVSTSQCITCLRDRG